MEIKKECGGCKHFCVCSIQDDLIIKSQILFRVFCKTSFNLANILEGLHKLIAENCKYFEDSITEEGKIKLKEMLGENYENK